MMSEFHRRSLRVTMYRLLKCVTGAWWCTCEQRLCPCLTVNPKTGEMLGLDVYVLAGMSGQEPTAPSFQVGPSSSLPKLGPDFLP